eukprot:TRINITY_DN574_c0_g1_i2.p2 TRINITY_DN574_c0_g1~~TRINITY_DN574_c0_g1_i2.p2  ORF type:complete len:232 (+),score=61.63 TRINITY_DN574_c0_g1_i2:21-716(+)
MESAKGVTDQEGGGLSLEFDFDEVFNNENEQDSDRAGSLENLPEGPHPDDKDPQVLITLPIEKTEEEGYFETADNGDFAVDLTDDKLKQKLGKDDFTIEKVIGRGGFGKVLLVTKKDSGDVYAMKVLRKEFLISTNNVEYSFTERNVLRKIRHPFVVTLQYAFQTSGKLYLVMDFLNGGQLFYHLRKQAMFSEEHVKFYAAEIILALEYLHKLHIVHRDLKPENILLDSDG